MVTNCRGASALAHQGRLPVKKVRHPHLAPARPLQLVAGGDGAVARGQVFPRVRFFAPVVEEPRLAQLLGRVELLFEIVLESDEHIVIRGVIARGLVVELPADHVGVVLVVRDDVADEPLGIKPVRGRVGVHVLADAVDARHRLAAERARRNAIREDLRVLVAHPRRDGIGGRAEDHLDAGLAHRIHDVVHPRVFEAAVFRLPQAPRRLAHAHDVQAGGLHQRDVFFQALILRIRRVLGHVLVVVGRAIEDGGKLDLGARPLLDCAGNVMRSRRSQEEDRERKKSFTEMSLNRGRISFSIHPWL